MKIDVREAIVGGFEETFSRAGIAFSVMIGIVTFVLDYFIFSALILNSSDTLVKSLNHLVAINFFELNVFMALITFIAWLVMLVWCCRTVQHEVKDFIPIDFLERNMPSAVINCLAGGLLMAVLLSICFIPFIIPVSMGLETFSLVGAIFSSLISFLVLSGFPYWLFFVTVEDKNFIDGYNSNYKSIKNNFLGSIGLMFVIAVIALFLHLIIFLAWRNAATMSVAPGLALGITPSILLGGISTVFILSSLSEAYNQMTGK